MNIYIEHLSKIKTGRFAQNKSVFFLHASDENYCHVEITGKK